MIGKRELSTRCKTISAWCFSEGLLGTKIMGAYLLLKMITARMTGVSIAARPAAVWFTQGVKPSARASMTKAFLLGPSSAIRTIPQIITRIKENPI
jgi:hypothetical protein